METNRPSLCQISEKVWINLSELCHPWTQSCLWNTPNFHFGFCSKIGCSSLPCNSPALTPCPPSLWQILWRCPLCLTSVLSCGVKQSTFQSKWALISRSDPKVPFRYGRATEMCHWNQSHFPKECAISVFRAGINKSAHSVQAWAIVSIGYQQQRRRTAARETPSKRLLMKRRGESEGPVLGSIFILAEL